MPEIEFIETEPPYQLPAHAEPRRQRPALHALAPAGLAVSAAVLSLIAPFQRVYAILEPRAKRPSLLAEGLDGWGRVTLPGGSFNENHGARYGIILMVVVALCAAASVMFALALVRASQPVLRTAARWAMICAAGATAAMAGSFYLTYRALHDSLVFQQHDEDSGFSPEKLVARLGPSTWLLAAAALCCALAVLSSVWIERQGARDSARLALEPTVPGVLSSQPAPIFDIYAPEEHLPGGRDDRTH